MAEKTEPFLDALTLRITLFSRLCVSFNIFIPSETLTLISDKTSFLFLGADWYRDCYKEETVFVTEKAWLGPSSWSRSDEMFSDLRHIQREAEMVRSSLTRSVPG